MNLRLSFFTSRKMKNYILPEIDNSDYSIILDKNKFGLKKNLVIELQVIDKKWSFKHSNLYTLVRNKNDDIYAPIKKDDIFSLKPINDIAIRISVSEIDISFDSFIKYRLDKNMKVTIGRDTLNTICYDMQDYISKEHAVIVYEGNEWYLIDKSKNGVYINEQRVGEKCRLKSGNRIEIYGLRIIFFNDILAISSENDVRIDRDILKPYVNRNSNVITKNKESVEKKFFHRAPRNIEKIFKEKVEIEAPPTLRKPEEKPLLLMIGPSLTMAIPMLLGCGMAIMASRMSGGSNLFMFTGIITAVGSAMIGAIWTLINLRYSNKQFNKAEEIRFNAYGQYLIDTAEKIRKMYETNISSMNKQYPAANMCCQYDRDSYLLWNRNLMHDDIMYYRLGVGELPFQTEIEIPKEKFKIDNDELEKKPKQIRDGYKILYNVPIGVDLLDHRIVGIVGGENRTGAFEVVKCLTAQIAASNSYTDVKMAFVYNKENEINNQWQFVKWFPHVWMEEKKGRFVASDKFEASNLFFELTNILRIRSEKSETIKKEKFIKPHYILFVEEMSWLEGEPISKYITDANEEYGLTTIILAEKYSELPNRCDYIIYNNNEFQGIYDINSDENKRTKVQFDKISAEELETFSRKLMNIEISEVEVNGDITSSLDFFEMYGIKSLEELDVLEHWKKNRTYESMKALIGKKAGDVNCYLDIHEKYHGPHGLVAGTTGSGKSEMLQTYILSLSINFSPNDIAFFVIDFKGGGMANLFSNLPHSIGQISNLSGNQVRRAMVSIKSENMRRQRIFSENGVNNINSYTKLFKNNEVSIPVPHLFIIIDEFAELKKEEPEFMKELISVAQVGRSLGVHLILATQKPSGTVDDNIWSNSKFRLCLRVQDRQDSKDMLHKPDAAYITQAGRGYLQVGNDEVYDYFQSGWSGAIYNENADDVTSDMVTLIGLDGKAEMVGNKMRIKQKEQKRREWLKALSKNLKKSAEIYQMDIKEYCPNTMIANNILTETIKYVNQEGFKFDDTVLNRQRIDDFIALWKKIKNEDYIEEIVELAETTGKRLPEVKEVTQLDAIVEYLQQIAKNNGYKKSMQLWLPVLPEVMYLSDLPGYEESSCLKNGYEKNNEWTLEAFVGMYDDPVNQSQNPVILDFAKNGHHVICGTVMSGKSTFMQTLIYSLMCRYSPEYINFYLLDFSSKMMSAFEKSKHVGGVLYENDIEKIKKLFNMISGILEKRKELFKGGNYEQFVRANGIVIPSIFICIDNYGSFRSKTNNIYDDFMVKLSNEGAGYGIFIVLTSGGFGTNEIPNSLRDNIKTSISLEMSDKFKYGDILKTMKFDILPESNIRGRGLISINESILEFQTALALEAVDDYSRLEEIKKDCEKLNSMWDGIEAKLVPEIPPKPTWADIIHHEEFKKLISDEFSLPVAYNELDASLYCVDLRKTYCYILSGKRKTGKTNMIKVMAQAFKAKGADVCIIDTEGNELKKFANGLDADYIVGEQALCIYLEKILEKFIPRNKKKKDLIAQGASEIEIYRNMIQNKSIAILINDFTDFISIINKPLKNDKYDFKGIIENLFEKGYMHNIYFIGAINSDDVSILTGKRAYGYFINDKNGIHMGGNVINQRIFEFPDMKYNEMSSIYKPGIGLVTSGETGTKKIIIPIADINL